MTRLKPILLDTFCGGGGCTKGYQRAGFYVVGVDDKPQPHYCGDEFIQADILEYLATSDLSRYAAIHASPPCQGYSNVTRWTGDQDSHVKLIDPTRKLLVATGKLWVIENVRTKYLNADLMLCGTMFGLRIIRHRYFEFSQWIPINSPATCNHSDFIPFMHKDERAFADAMGCTWMDKVTARQAIPPAYTEYIGNQFMRILQCKP